MMCSIHERVEIALSDLLPRMITDGGGTHIVAVENNVVTLQMEGTCRLCPSRERSARALKQGIAARVPDITVRVINTNIHGQVEEL